MAARWQLAQENPGTPRPLLLLVLFWFVIIFASFGLFAPRNITATLRYFSARLGSVGRSE
jgi:hypothetical protein